MTDLRAKAREMVCLAMTYPLGTEWQPSERCEKRMREAMAEALEWGADEIANGTTWRSDLPVGFIDLDAANFLRAEAKRLRAEGTP